MIETADEFPNTVSLHLTFNSAFFRNLLMSVSQDALDETESY